MDKTKQEVTCTQPCAVVDQIVMRLVPDLACVPWNSWKPSSTTTSYRFMEEMWISKRQDDPPEKCSMPSTDSLVYLSWWAQPPTDNFYQEEEGPGRDGILCAVGFRQGEGRRHSHSPLNCIPKWEAQRANRRALVSQRSQSIIISLEEKIQFFTS